MSEEKLSRQQRKQLIKEEVKSKLLSNYQPTPQPSAPPNQVNNLAQDIQRVLNYSKAIDNHIWMIVETLARKNILTWADVNETERLFVQKDENKKQKVKDILSKDLSIEEILKEIEEDPSLPAYSKLSINPVKDLNLNPFELANYLKEKHPDKSDDDYLKLGKTWGLTLEHFGIKGNTGITG